MSYQQRTLSAAGWSTPIWLSQYSSGRPPLVNVELSTNANLTWSAYAINNRMKRSQQLACDITRVTTTATLVLKTGAHPKAGDLVYVEGAGAPFDGWFVVASATGTTQLTYAVANSGATQALPGARVQIFRPIAIAAGMTTQTADASAAISTMVPGFVLNVSVYTAGSATMRVSAPR